MDESVKRLSRLDCCAVSDAMDALSISDQIASGLRQESGSRRIAGRAITLRLLRSAEVACSGAAARHLGTHAIENASPGDVIVVEQRTGIDAGSWGGILTLGAKLRGVSGVVADGPVRDIDEARGYEFPVFCRTLTARTARGRVAEVEGVTTITIGGVTVKAGDYVVADASGVAFIPAEDAERVLDVAERIFRKEAAMAKALLSGKRITEVMGSDYEHMLHMPSEGGHQDD
ncbi:RraA family protein [Paraburkholderia sp. BCC1885]|uniref:RraA family protein n=1 Tax=Paraburkholderia sp. BCC1885 TaxID=2562669 RepID=UPI001182FFF7|nr:RraA family protein [Paraburkholderia sp. BCC1885]